MNLLDGKGRGTGITKAANGDLLNWVSFGAMDSNGNFGFKIFFAGGTGRFEHAVGSWEGEFEYTTQPDTPTGIRAPARSATEALSREGLPCCPVAVWAALLQGAKRSDSS